MVNGDKGIEYISYLAKTTLIQHTIPVVKYTTKQILELSFSVILYTLLNISLSNQIQKNYHGLKIFIKASYMIYCIMFRT